MHTKFPNFPLSHVFHSTGAPHFVHDPH
jgi:hypothetical protein